MQKPKPTFFLFFFLPSNTACLMLDASQLHHFHHHLASPAAQKASVAPTRSHPLPGRPPPPSSPPSPPPPSTRSQFSGCEVPLPRRLPRLQQLPVNGFASTAHYLLTCCFALPLPPILAYSQLPTPCLRQCRCRLATHSGPPPPTAISLSPTTFPFFPLPLLPLTPHPNLGP